MFEALELRVLGVLGLRSRIQGAGEAKAFQNFLLLKCLKMTGFNYGCSRCFDVDVITYDDVYVAHRVPAVVTMMAKTTNTLVDKNPKGPSTQ